MTHNFQNNDDDADLALLRHYDTPVPPDFQKALLHELGSQLPRPRSPSRPLIGITGIAAAVALVVWLALPPAETPRKKLVLAGSTNPAIPDPMAIPTHDSLYSTITYADDIAQAPLIVIARVDDARDFTATCTIVSTIYGTTDDTTLQIEIAAGNPDIRKEMEQTARELFFRDNNREPAPEELIAKTQWAYTFGKGDQGILLLAPAPLHAPVATPPLTPQEVQMGASLVRAANVKGKTTNYYLVRREFLQPAVLAARLKELAAIIRDGTYLKPNPIFTNQFLLEPKIAAAEAIVRATLISVNNTQSNWHIDKMIKGNTAETVVLPHDLFDRRAEALVRIAALNDPALADPALHAARFKEERDALIKAELPAGQTTILLLGNVQTIGAISAATLQGRDFQLLKSNNLTATEQTIVKALQDNPKLALAPAPAVSAGLSRGMGSGPATAKDQQALEATLIVRATITGWTGQNIEYAVNRVIYGDLAEKTLHINFLESNINDLLAFSRDQYKLFHAGREPNEGELYGQFMQDHTIIKGREVILLLKPIMDRPISSKIKPLPVKPARYESIALFRDAPPNWPLDPVEAEFVQIIKDGTFLEPLPPPNGRNVMEVSAEDRALFLKWYVADAVVRATALETSAAGTRWRIDKSIKGKVDAAELLIPNDIFEKRAKAVADFAAKSDAALKDPATRASRQAQEMKDMLATELPPGRQAILFLDNLKPAGTATAAELTARVYDFSKRVALKDLEAAMNVPSTTPKE